MSDTPLQSSHTHALALGRVHQRLRELAQRRSDVKEKVWREWSTGFLLHQDTGDQPGFTAIGWGASRGGFHDSAAASWHGSSSAISLSPLLSLCRCNSLPICLLPQCRLAVGGIPVSKHIIPLIPFMEYFGHGILQTWHVMERYSFGFIFPHTKSTADSVYSPTPAPCFCSFRLQFADSNVLWIALQKNGIIKNTFSIL